MSGLLDPDSSREYLEVWKTRIDQMAADTQALSNRLERLRVTAADQDGLVEVTIDATGVLVDVRFAARIQRVSPEAVSRAVLGALRLARQDAAAQSRQIITETLGAGSVAGRAIAERMARQPHAAPPTAAPGLDRAPGDASTGGYTDTSAARPRKGEPRKP